MDPTKYSSPLVPDTFTFFLPPQPSSNNLGPSGATAIVASLALLTSLQSVDLRCPAHPCVHLPLHQPSRACPPSRSLLIASAGDGPSFGTGSAHRASKPVTDAISPAITLPSQAHNSLEQHEPIMPRPAEALPCPPSTPLARSLVHSFSPSLFPSLAH